MELFHSGVEGMRWGVRNGPPYPLGRQKNLSDVKNLQKEMKGFRYKNFDKLMAPKDVVKTRKGSCHDQSLYAYTRLKGLGFDPKIKFLIEADDSGQGGMTHSFCWFKDGKAVYWLENSWENQRGLRSYPSEQAMMKDVYSRWEKRQEFQHLYSGDAVIANWTPGMELQEMLNRGVRWRD